MTNYQVRAAEIDDIEAISSVASQSWSYTYADIFPEDFIRQFVARAYSKENLAHSIKRDCELQTRWFHVAEDSDGQIIAFAHSVPTQHNTTFELLRIYALPETHGTGAGSALLQHLFKTATTLNKLFAWVEKENAIGKQFYERHGFLKTKEKEDVVLGHKTMLLKYEYVLD